MRYCRMQRSLRALAGIALIFISACSSAAQSTRQPLPTDVVATVDQTSITLAEVDERALAQPVGNFSALRLVDALYEARRGAIDDMINARLLEREAKAEGIAMTDLLQSEITGQGGAADRARRRGVVQGQSDPRAGRADRRGARADQEPAAR